MDFIDKIRNLANRIPGQLEYCQTEEATKNALIMPFINALGYDVFDPTEVVPEFTADIGTKKGEKVDYAIIKDGKPIILFECKWSGSDLNKEHASQLHRYFSAVSEVRFGILTNGVIYRFYSDLDAPNRMDSKPFFEFNMLDVRKRTVMELKKFTKSTFDLDEILTTASELKYTAAMRKLIAQEFEAPSEEFVRFFATQVYSGRMTQSVREQFAEITHRALRRFLNEQISERLQSALQDPEQRTMVAVEATGEQPKSEVEEVVEDTSKKGREIVTTEDEIEGFFVVKSILRKSICRLHFNRTQKYLGIVDENKQSQRIPIDGVDDIYSYAEQIIAVVKRLDSD